VSYSLVQDTNNPTDSGLLRSEVPLGQAANTNASLVPTNGLSASAAPRDDASAGATPPRNGAVANQVQFVRFRYWDGSAWAEAWAGPDLPAGVEVSLGGDPLPPELPPDQYPFELYRRVFYLPNHGTNAAPGLGAPALTQAAQ
jgi:hypothetical protein